MSFFTSRLFANAWASVYPHYQVMQVNAPSKDLEPCFALRELLPGNKYLVRLTAAGLPFEPARSNPSMNQGWVESVREHFGRDVACWIWSIGFDQGELAQTVMQQLRLTPQDQQTHVLELNCSHEQLRAAYSATLRRHVRQSERRGVEVRRALSMDEVRTYFELTKRLEEQKSDYHQHYPLGLFEHLVQCQEDVALLLSWYGDKCVAGALFFRHDSGVFYWHGASDREHSQLHGAPAVLDAGIGWACENNANWVNFGSSNTADLQRFKESWGCRARNTWCFQWNPPASRLSRLRLRLARTVNDFWNGSK